LAKSAYSLLFGENMMKICPVDPDFYLLTGLFLKKDINASRKYRLNYIHDCIY